MTKSSKATPGLSVGAVRTESTIIPPKSVIYNKEPVTNHSETERRIDLAQRTTNLYLQMDLHGLRGQCCMDRTSAGHTAEGK